MKIIWDASILTMYPLGTCGFRGGTELMIEQLCHRLADMGHQVHLVTRDLEQEEQRGPNLWYWPQSYHPTKADVVVQTQQLVMEQLAQYEADKIVLMHTGCDPYLNSDGSWSSGVDAWPVFSETHKRLLLEQRPSIPENRVFVVGLGVDVADYLSPILSYKPISSLPTNAERLARSKAAGRLLYANDPIRGLFYVLDIFDLVKKQVSDASLHIAYDFNRQFAVHQWEHTFKAQLMIETKRRIETTVGVVNLGAVSREQLIREQLECQVHCMPSDPPNIGTQTHGIMQMECAAAGASLILSDVEAFPEVFGEAATILPVIGYFDGTHRCSAYDYAEVVIELMRDDDKWKQASRKARTLAEKNTWDACAKRWDEMLAKIMQGVAVA